MIVQCGNGGINMGWIFGAVGVGFIAFILWCLCAAAGKELPPIDEDEWNDDKEDDI
jgi:hypothetical protein